MSSLQHVSPRKENSGINLTELRKQIETPAEDKVRGVGFVLAINGLTEEASSSPENRAELVQLAYDTWWKALSAEQKFAMTRTLKFSSQEERAVIDTILDADPERSLLTKEQVGVLLCQRGNLFGYEKKSEDPAEAKANSEVVIATLTEGLTALREGESFHLAAHFGRQLALYHERQGDYASALALCDSVISDADKAGVPWNQGPGGRALKAYLTWKDAQNHEGPVSSEVIDTVRGLYEESRALDAQATLSGLPGHQYRSFLLESALSLDPSQRDQHCLDVVRQVEKHKDGQGVWGDFNKGCDLLSLSQAYSLLGIDRETATSTFATATQLAEDLEAKGNTTLQVETDRAKDRMARAGISIQA